MKRAKYKVGDRVTVQHIGTCEVRKVVALNGSFAYVLECDGELFSVGESGIEGLVE